MAAKIFAACCWALSMLTGGGGGMIGFIFGFILSILFCGYANDAK